MSTEDIRLAWPLPPAHYAQVGVDTLPPQLPPLLRLASTLPASDEAGLPGLRYPVYDTPLDETYETQQAALRALVSDQDLAATPLDLVRSILVTFLQLVATLRRAPSASGPLEEHLERLLLALHHALNEQRPLQARVTLLALLELQVTRRRKLLDQINRRIASAAEHLEEARCLLNQATQ